MSQRSGDHSPLSFAAVFSAVQGASADAANVTAKSIVAVLGSTGVGKSTLLHFLHGDELGMDMYRDRRCIDVVEGLTNIGHSDSSAKTVETRRLSDGVTTVEMPDAFDAGTAEQKLQNGVMNALVLSGAEEVRLVLVLPLDSVRGGGEAMLRSLQNIERLLAAVPAALDGVRVVISGARHNGDSEQYLTLSQSELVQEVLPEVEKAVEKSRERGVIDGAQLLNYLHSGLCRTRELCSGPKATFGPCMVFNPFDVASRPAMVEAIAGGPPVRGFPASAFRASLPVDILLDTDLMLHAIQPARGVDGEAKEKYEHAPREERRDDYESDFIVLPKPVECPTLTTSLRFHKGCVTRACIVLSHGGGDLRCRVCQCEAFEMKTAWCCAECEYDFLVCGKCLRSQDFATQHSHSRSRFRRDKIALHSTTHLTIDGLQNRPIVVSLIPASQPPRKMLANASSSFIVLLQPSSMPLTAPVDEAVLVRSVRSEGPIRLSFCLAANGACQLLLNGSVLAAKEGLDTSIAYRIGFLHFEGQLIRRVGFEETPRVGSMRLIAPLNDLRSFANESLDGEAVCGKAGRVVKVTTTGRATLQLDDARLLDLPIAATRSATPNPSPAPPSSASALPLIRQVLSLQATLQRKLKVQLRVDATPAVHRRAFSRLVESCDGSPPQGGLMLAVAAAAAQLVLSDPREVVCCTPKLLAEVEALRVRAHRAVSSFDARMSVAAHQMSNPDYKPEGATSPLAKLFEEHRLTLQGMLTAAESLFAAAGIPQWVEENEKDRMRARDFSERVSIRNRLRADPTFEKGTALGNVATSQSSTSTASGKPCFPETRALDVTPEQLRPNGRIAVSGLRRYFSCSAISD